MTPPLDLREWGKVTGGGAPPFTPATIPGLLAWFDPDAAYVTKAGTPERTSSWVSREGNAYTLVQAAGPAQPEWSATGIQSRPAMLYDGAQYLDGAGGLATLLSGAVAFSVVSVIRPLFTGTRSIWAFNPAGAGLESRLAYYRLNVVEYAATYTQRDGVGTTLTATTTALPAPSWWTTLHTGSAVSFQIDGANVAGGADTRAPNVVSFSTGGRLSGGAWGVYLRGWIADVIVYDHALTAAELAVINAWVRRKYAGI